MTDDQKRIEALEAYVKQLREDIQTLQWELMIARNPMPPIEKCNHLWMADTSSTAAGYYCLRCKEQNAFSYRVIQ